jgi:Na+/proline symporter
MTLTTMWLIYLIVWWIATARGIAYININNPPNTKLEWSNEVVCMIMVMAFWPLFAALELLALPYYISTYIIKKIYKRNNP